MAGSQDLAITAIIMNKHSLVAWGLFHPTTAVDPGFKGSLALTFFNLGSTSLRIKYQDPVAKVMFFCSPESERKYGVNQSPRYREGSTDSSLIVDRSPEEMSDLMLRKMYGAPVRRLYDAVATLAAHKDVLHIKSEEKRKEEKASERRSFSADLMIAFFGAILALGLPALWTAAQSWLLSVKIAP